MTVERHPRHALAHAEKSRLRHLVEEIERETGVEIAAVIVRHVPDIEAFATAYFNHVGIGKLGHDNGILIAIAADRRLVRIEVGRGLEHVVTGEVAARIIAGVMVPQLRRERYGEAMLRAVEALGHVVRGAPDRLPR